MLNIFHFTDKNGWNAMRAQKVWCFKASQPKDPRDLMALTSRTSNRRKQT